MEVVSLLTCAYVWCDWVFLFLSLFHFSSEPFCIPNLQANTSVCHSSQCRWGQEGGRRKVLIELCNNGHPALGLSHEYTEGF